MKKGPHNDLRDRLTLFDLPQVFECPKHPTTRWSLSYPEGCTDLVPALYVQAGLNIVSDITILLLPIPSLVRLKVNRAKKSMARSAGGSARRY